MKHVRKGLSPTAFEDWKALANADWAPTYGALRNPEKGVLHQELRQLSHAFRAWDSEGRAESFGHAVARFSEQRLLDAGATEIGL
jgi:hypothetical protein